MADFDSSLPIRTENDGDAVVKIADATTPSQQWSITALGEGLVNVSQPLPTGTNNIGEVSIQDSNGNPISNTNPLPVTFSTSPSGDEINDYDVATALAAGGTSNHDYTVTALKTFELFQIWASASGKLKIEVQIETGVATGIFNTYFVGFNSTATPVIDLDLTKPITVAAGVRVRVIRTNNDNQAQNVYSTICGSEI